MMADRKFRKHITSSLQLLVVESACACVEVEEVVEVVMSDDDECWCSW